MIRQSSIVFVRAAVVVAGLACATASFAKDQVVFQLTEADPARGALVLNNVRNLQAGVGTDDIDIEVVAYGPGVVLLKADSPLAARIAETVGRSVKVVACENTMAGMKLAKTDMVPEVGYVPAGVVEVMRKQQQGYAYIRPERTMVSLLSNPAVVPSLLAVLIGWRIYRRVRRLIGRQPVRTRRLVLTVVLFPLLLVLVGATGLRDPVLLEGLVAGVAVGIGLGLLALKLTRFEVTEVGCFFVPNTTIGIAVSLLFIGRLVYRFAVLYCAGGRLDPGSMQSFGSSPLTLAILGVVAAYYTTFAVGVLAWYRGARRQVPAVAGPGA